MTTEIKRLQFIDGINVNTPTQSGETIFTKTLVTTTPYTPTQDETVLYVDTTIGNITINLPSAATAAIVNKFYIIKKITNDANKVIVDPNGAETIDAVATKDIEFFNDCLQCHSDGTNWKIISQNLFSNQVFNADFVQSDGVISSNLSFYAGVGGGDMSVSISSFDGSALSVANYATVVFHGSTNASGVMNRRKITSNLSITIPNGATLGFLSGDETPFYLYAVDTGAGIVLGVSRLQLNENEMYSSTAISNAADANNVLYTTASQTTKPIRLLAKIISTQATAGNWLTAPTKIYTNNNNIEQEKIIDFYINNAGQALSTNPSSPTVFTCSTKVKSTHGAYSNSTGYLTCPKDGFLKATIAYYSAAATPTQVEILAILYKVGATTWPANALDSFSRASGTYPTTGNYITGNGELKTKVLAGEQYFIGLYSSLAAQSLNTGNTSCTIKWELI